MIRLFNLPEWKNPIYVRGRAVGLCLGRARRELAECTDANETRRLQQAIARYEHAQRRIETEQEIIDALSECGSPSVARELAREMSIV
jgi:hypothetical protein